MLQKIFNLKKKRKLKLIFTKKKVVAYSIHFKILI